MKNIRSGQSPREAKTLPQWLSTASYSHPQLMDVIHQLPHSSVVPYFSFSQGKAENDSEVVAGCEDNIQVFPSQASLHHAINIGCFIPLPVLSQCRTNCMKF